MHLCDNTKTLLLFLSHLLIVYKYGASIPAVSFSADVLCSWNPLFVCMIAAELVIFAFLLSSEESLLSAFAAAHPCCSKPPGLCW